jgi:adenylosuccinate lyase
MRDVFSWQTTLQCWLDVEAALAGAEAEAGLIPAAAAEEIARNCRMQRLDLDAIAAEYARTDHLIMSVVHAVSSRCQGDAGQYVHWGATTQDITDTALAIQLGRALDIVGRQLCTLLQTLVVLVKTHRATPMLGRTHGQHAAPLTFGFKAAVWTAELGRHLTRLTQLRPRVLVGQLGGAVGTGAVLGPQLVAVRAGLCHRVGLFEPPVAWHTSRDGLAELAAVLGLVAATGGKIASEIVELQRTEVAEVAEAVGPDNVGSSTMPQKRNPMRSEAVVAASRVVRGAVATMLELMHHEHERDYRASLAEPAVLPGACIAASGMLADLEDVLGGLEVDAERMRTNLAAADAVAAEHVMMALATRLGRQRAHDLVHRILAGRPAGHSATEALAADEEVRAQLGDAAAVRAAVQAGLADVGAARDEADRVARLTSEMLERSPWRG